MPFATQSAILSCPCNDLCFRPEFGSLLNRRSPQLPLGKLSAKHVPATLCVSKCPVRPQAANAPFVFPGAAGAPVWQCSRVGGTGPLLRSTMPEQLERSNLPPLKATHVRLCEFCAFVLLPFAMGRLARHDLLHLWVRSQARIGGSSIFHPSMWEPETLGCQASILLCSPFPSCVKVQCQVVLGGLLLDLPYFIYCLRVHSKSKMPSYSDILDPRYGL